MFGVLGLGGRSPPAPPKKGDSMNRKGGGGGSQKLDHVSRLLGSPVTTPYL